MHFDAAGTFLPTRVGVQMLRVMCVRGWCADDSRECASKVGRTTQTVRLERFAFPFPFIDPPPPPSSINVLHPSVQLQS